MNFYPKHLQGKFKGKLYGENLRGKNDGENLIYGEKFKWKFMVKFPI